MAITTRAGKGSALTHSEMDTNFTDLRDGVALQVPKTQNSGIKVDSLGTPTFGWQDLHSELHLSGTGDPVWSNYIGTIDQLKFSVGNDVHFSYHLPHDYAVGTDMFIHAHWSHNNAFVTGGSIVWSYELTYAKGHDQASFSAPVTFTASQVASTTQYFHQLIEVPASVVGGSPTQLNTSLLEPDGLIFGRIYLSTNGISVSSGPVPDPFLHQVDMHYQTTGVATKQRFPSFWG